MSREPKLSKYGDEALLTLVELMRSGKSEPVRVAAAREVLDRTHGKPKGDDADDGPSLQEMIRRAFERDDR